MRERRLCAVGMCHRRLMCALEGNCSLYEANLMPFEANMYYRRQTIL